MRRDDDLQSQNVIAIWDPFFLGCCLSTFCISLLLICPSAYELQFFTSLLHLISLPFPEQPATRLPPPVSSFMSLKFLLNLSTSSPSSHFFTNANPSFFLSFPQYLQPWTIVNEHPSTRKVVYWLFGIKCKIRQRGPLLTQNNSLMENANAREGNCHLLIMWEVPRVSCKHLREASNPDSGSQGRLPGGAESYLETKGMREAESILEKKTNLWCSEVWRSTGGVLKVMENLGSHCSKECIVAGSWGRH